MNAVSFNDFLPDTKLFEPKARAAARALEGRYASLISSDEIDHLFARFVLGLTMPAYGAGDPGAHLAACRSLLSLKLTPERVEHVLFSVPVATKPWVEEACNAIEQFGTRDGQALLKEIRNSTQDDSDATCELHPQALAEQEISLSQQEEAACAKR
ncbi:hypothetical protein ABFT80_21690 [Mesorhizobium sp. SB112]|uniref:hypothetical protein n=1 Tax=Mesorhizobium sp. SB112 TaxID=3151853 RepID=UPI003264933E